MNNPVLITGTDKLQSINAKTRFLSLRSLKIKPATNPAIVHLVKHARKVPKGLTGINNANVVGETRAMMPLKKPTIAPDIGPPKIAAIVTATNDKLILTGPNCK